MQCVDVFYFEQIVSKTKTTLKRVISEIIMSDNSLDNTFLSPEHFQYCRVDLFWQCWWFLRLGQQIHSHLLKCYKNYFADAVGGALPFQWLSNLRHEDFSVLTFIL